EHAERCGIRHVLQVRLVAAATAENQQPHVRQHRVRLLAELDRVIDLAGAHELDDTLDEFPSVDLGPDDDRVESLDEYGESRNRHDEDEVHDGAAGPVVFQHFRQHREQSSTGRIEREYVSVASAYCHAVFDWYPAVRCFRRPPRANRDVRDGAGALATVPGSPASAPRPPRWF